MLEFLRDHPLIGAITSIGSTVGSWLTDAKPVLEIGAIIVGLVIGIITLLLKVEELAQVRETRRQRLREKRKHEE